MRLADKFDYLEAFTVFDPRPEVRVKTKPMVRTFLITLLNRFRMPAARAVEFDSATVILWSKFVCHDFGRGGLPIR